jgi:hypothetical protein
MFFNSTNNTEEILKNYNDAVSSCRLALTILNEGKTFVTGGSSASSGKIIRCTISKDDAKRVWQDQLKSLTDENDMRRMVDTGSLNIYIFDTVKREVFDRSRR